MSDKCELFDKLATRHYTSAILYLQQCLYDSQPLQEITPATSSSVA